MPLPLTSERLQRRIQSIKYQWLKTFTPPGDDEVRVAIARKIFDRVIDENTVFLDITNHPTEALGVSIQWIGETGTSATFEYNQTSITNDDLTDDVEEAIVTDEMGERIAG